MAQKRVTFGAFIRSFFHNWKGKLWFLLNMFFTIMYLIWRVFFTIPFEYGIVSVVTGIALLVVEVLGMVEAFIHYANMYSVEDYPFPRMCRLSFFRMWMFLSLPTARMWNCSIRRFGAARG